MALSPTRSRFTLSSLADDLGPVVVTADVDEDNADNVEAQPATRVAGRPVLVRVPTWRKVGAVKHVYTGGSWNASSRPADKKEPLSTETFERHVKLAAMAATNSGLARSPLHRSGSSRAKTPKAGSFRAGAGYSSHLTSPLSRSSMSPNARNGRVRTPGMTRRSAGHAPAARPVTSHGQRSKSSTLPTSPSTYALHSLRSGRGFGSSHDFGGEHVPTSPSVRTPNAFLKRPSFKQVSVVTTATVPTSYVPWSPIHRAPRGQWNKSKAPDPRAQPMSNDAYVRQLGVAAMQAAPGGGSDRVAGWRQLISRSGSRRSRHDVHPM